MKISLLSIPFVKNYMRNARCDFISLSNTQWYPIWLGWAGAFFESKGCIVQIIDGQCEEVSKDNVFNRVKIFEPDLIVIYGGLKSRETDLNFGKRIVKELNKKVVFVGPYVSIEPESFIIPEIKEIFAVQGEFEYPVFELLQDYEPEKIKNLCYVSDNNVIVNPVRPYMSREELDKIPFVTDFFIRHLNISLYKAPSEYHPFIDFMTGRGCGWGRCTFCLWVWSFIKGHVYNKRSVENVVDEFEFVVKKIPFVKSIMIQDDTLMPERALELSEAIIKRNLKIPWSCYMRPDCSYEILKAMKQAGCRNLHIGYETSNLETIRKIKKGVTREIMTEFTRNAKKAGLRIHGDFVIAFPYETEQSIKDTIDWSLSLRPDTAQYQLFIPYPKTLLYEEMKKNNWLNKNGEPDYPQLSNEKMRSLSKYAYRKFYISKEYLLECIKHPYDRVFKRFDTYLAAIPAIFWKRWK